MKLTNKQFYLALYRTVDTYRDSARIFSVEGGCM